MIEATHVSKTKPGVEIVHLKVGPIPFIYTWKNDGKLLLEHLKSSESAVPVVSADVYHKTIINTINLVVNVFFYG